MFKVLSSRHRVTSRGPTEPVALPFTGGRRAPRSEAFIIGEPLRELGVALSQSHTSELVAAPSVTRALGELPGEQRDGGCTCLTFPLHVPDLWTADIPFPEVIQLGSAGGSLRGFKRRGPPKRTKATTVKDLRERLLRRSGADDEYHKSARTTANPPVARLARGDDTDATVSYDLEELLRFMPEFVKHRMFATRGTRLFAEHRYVSVLFVIGTMKVRLPLFTVIYTGHNISLHMPLLMFVSFVSISNVLVHLQLIPCRCFAHAHIIHIGV